MAVIMEMFFNAPDGQDPKLAQRASTYFQVLILNPDCSPAALAIASVISSLTSPTKAGGAGNPQSSRRAPPARPRDTSRRTGFPAYSSEVGPLYG